MFVCISFLFIKLLGSLKKIEEKLCSGNREVIVNGLVTNVTFKCCLLRKKVCSVMEKKIINNYQAQILIYF